MGIAFRGVFLGSFPQREIGQMVYILAISNSSRTRVYRYHMELDSNLVECC